MTLSFEQWNYLFGALVAAVLSVTFARLAREPARTRLCRVLVNALDNWYLSARWSADPKVRLRRMAVVCALLALLGVVLLMLDPQPRYRR